MKKLITAIMSGMFLVSAAGCSTYNTKTTKNPTGTNQGVTYYGQRTGVDLGTGAANRSINYSTPGMYNNYGTYNGTYGSNTGTTTDYNNRYSTNLGTMQGITTNQAINKTTNMNTNTIGKTKTTTKSKTHTVIKKITTVKNGKMTTVTETILKSW